MSEIEPQIRSEGAVKRPSTHTPAPGAGQQNQLKRAVGATEGYDAQAALLAPGQMWSGWGLFGNAATKRHGLERFRKRGRKANEKKEKLGKVDNPDYKAASQDELAGVAAVKAALDSNKDTYAPRIWVVEPTTRAGGVQ